MEVKPEATILDATAGNRLMWSTKNHPSVIFIDVEKHLEYPPDRFMNCTNTDFEDGRFHTIIFDPPHNWGIPYNERLFTIPSKERADEKFNYGRTVPPYYGLDKFKNRSELIAFIDKAQKEFHRILSPQGLLIFKWSEYVIPVHNIKCLFKDWIELLDFRLFRSPQGKNESWLVFYIKNILKDGGREE